MSGGKVTVGGTNYKIVGGKTTSGGTAYTIGRGKTTIGGTNYNIFLKPQDIEHLLKSEPTVWVNFGRNSDSKGTSSAALLKDGTYYAFVFCNGYLGIHKLVRSGSSVTKTVLKQMASNYSNLYISGTEYMFSNDGTNSSYATSVYGCGIIVLQNFKGYTVSQVDAILKSLSLTRLAGRNSSSARAISYASSSLVGKIALVSVGGHMAFTKITSASTNTFSGTVLFSTANAALTTTSLLVAVSSNIGYRYGTSGGFTNVNGGSLISIS